MIWREQMSQTFISTFDVVPYIYVLWPDFHLLFSNNAFGGGKPTDGGGGMNALRTDVNAELERGLRFISATAVSKEPSRARENAPSNSLVCRSIFAEIVGFEQAMLLLVCYSIS